MKFLLPRRNATRNQKTTRLVAKKKAEHQDLPPVDALNLKKKRKQTNVRADTVDSEEVALRRGGREIRNNSVTHTKSAAGAQACEFPG